MLNYLPCRLLWADDGDNPFLESSPLPHQSDVNSWHGDELEAEDRLAVAEPLRVPGHRQLMTHVASHLHQILLIPDLHWNTKN